jgi:hypothetical protein
MALALLEAQPERVDRLRENTREFRRALAARAMPVEEEGSQIIPLIVGEATDATELCEQALREGVFAQAIRPPTVPRDTARLRLTVIASHRPAELRSAAGVIAAAAQGLGLSEDEEPVATRPATEVEQPRSGRVRSRFGAWEEPEALEWGTTGRAGGGDLEVPEFVSGSRDEREVEPDPFDDYELDTAEVPIRRAA